MASDPPQNPNAPTVDAVRTIALQMLEERGRGAALVGVPGWTPPCNICFKRCRAVRLGLRTLVRLQQQGEIRSFRGRLHWEGDLETQRFDSEQESAELEEQESL